MARGRRRRRGSRRSSGPGSFSTGRGAATVMRSHISKQGLKGNRKPGSSRRATQNAQQRVGGVAGSNFDNSSLGK